MRCHNCQNEIDANQIRCPHCGETVRKPFFIRWIQGWGVVDVIVLLAVICGIIAFFWSFLINDPSKRNPEIWKIKAQAYEETVGLVKIIGTVQNVSDRRREGYMILELRCFDDNGRLVWQETATLENPGLEPEEETSFSFIIQKPEGLAYFNVKAISEDMYQI